MMSAKAGFLSTWLVVASSLGLALASLHWKRRARQDGDDDKYYLQRAHRLRLVLSKPVQSRFRVIAILVLENGQLIYGANDEAPPTISGSICAERGALLQYRLQQTGSDPRLWPRITKIYIVTDADVPVPPGLLCREYLYGHPATNDTTPVIMQSADQTSKPWVSSLQELYPHPSLYMKLSVEEQLIRGPVLAEEQQGFIPTTTDSPFSPDDVRQVIQAAQEAAQDDHRDVVHPIRYGAAILTKNHGILHAAAQRKALEYGATQDAVAQVLSLLWNDNKRHHKDNLPTMLLAHVDHFGLVHAPFAPARSMLMEHGLGDQIYVVLSDLSVVPARVLAPYVPVWK